MTIPSYPKFTELRKEHKPVFDALLQAYPPDISELTFTNIFAWRKPYGFTVSRYKDALLVRFDDQNGIRFLPPVGGSAAVCMEEVLRDAKAPFVRVPDDLALGVSPGGLIEKCADRDHADYLYAMEDLVALAGRRYDGKRNLIKKFKSTHTYEYMELRGATIKRCLPFQQAWCVLKDCQRNEGLQNEQAALFEMIDHFVDFNLLGAAITIESNVEAFVIAESLNPRTLVVHMLKAEPERTGLYQTILNEFLRRHARDFSLVNLEQDLGVAGLRKAKSSYYPISLIAKNTLTLNQ